MPVCAIITCRLQSKYFNLQKGGISYHSFPWDPPTRSKWIEATGRLDWIPTKTSTICSKHFLESDFFITEHRRFIKPFAIPQIETVKILNSLVKEASPTCSKASPACSKASPTCLNASSPRKRKLKAIISTKEDVIKRQRKQIKKLQTQIRRLKKKVNNLEDVLSELQQKSFLQSEQVSVLQNTNLQFCCKKNK